MITFVQTEKEILWKRLETWHQNSITNTTAETYLKLCEQLGEDPDPEKMPPDYEDFPLDVQLAILTYGKLGDKIVADIGYLGKDMTTLPLHIEINGIQDKELFIETILRLDELAIKKSNAEMKRHREKLASKAKA